MDNVTVPVWERLKRESLLPSHIRSVSYDPTLTLKPNGLE